MFYVKISFMIIQFKHYFNFDSATKWRRILLYITFFFQDDFVFSPMKNVVFHL